MTDGQPRADKGLQEIPTPSIMRQIAAMLDYQDLSLVMGDRVPRGWHFALLPATTMRSHLRPDGFAGLGVTLPDLGLPRLMLASRHVDYGSGMVVGETVYRNSTIESIQHKGTPERPRALLKVRHVMQAADGNKTPLVETQTFILMPPGNGYQPAKVEKQEIHAEIQRQVIPDATLLFHYSALGFNAHKIHLERDYTRYVEGFPDLVVNGGLTALLITEFARLDLELELASLDIQYKAPLFCDRPATIAAEQLANEGDAIAWQITVHDDSGVPAALAKVIAA